MKEIKAIIRPTKVGQVCKALRTSGYCCMTLSECEGSGMYTDPKTGFPSMKFPFMHSRMVKIEIVCDEEEVDQIIKIVQKNGTTGYRGDGIIYTVDVGELYKVKNGKKGAAC